MLALVGFGTKAGFIPLHVWLPEAHPAAPSHVSAVMSAVMIKTGIYGLVRVMMLLGAPQAWWGWVLCGIGLSSGVIGVLLALAQHDLKRLLAYHSVENIGIIALGLGVGTLGLCAGLPAVAVMGFAGALLHVLNHALFKGLLFLAAGNVVHSAHTREIDHLGGLLRRMPRTGAIFLIGAAAISGLPPLNGFISEFLIYLASFKGAVTLEGANSVPMLATIAGLALIGGLAAACFTKAFGIVFLGQPRSEHAEQAHEVGLAMVMPGVVLAAACILIGLLGASVVSVDGSADFGSDGTVGDDRPCKPLDGRTLHRIGEHYRWGAGRPSDAARYRPRASTFEQVGLHKCDLGLWLRRTVAANAVYRIVVRSTFDRHLRSYSCKHAAM